MFQKIVFFTLIFLAFSNCGNQPDTREENQTVSKKEEMNSDISPAVMEKGEDIYKKYCLACHQANGSGNPGMYPPLTGTISVKEDKEYLIGVVLNGLQGEIEVKGEIYNQVMAPHSFLSNKEIADVLTYIRNSFGNDYGEVTEEEVAALRTEE